MTNEPKEVGTLAEIGAKVGDVVVWRGKHYTVMAGVPYPEYIEPMLWASLIVPFKQHGDWISDEATGVSIISRKKPTGPVRTVTRKEIVPGVYGTLQVHACGDYTINESTAAELTAAIAHLTAIRDALVENEG